MNGPLETDDMLVVTLRMPTDDVEQLAVSVGDGLIRVLGPNGFRRDVPLPDGADADRLHAGLFYDVLELRAPRSAAPRMATVRKVSVRALGGGPRHSMGSSPNPGQGFVRCLPDGAPGAFEAHR